MDVSDEATDRELKDRAICLEIARRAPILVATGLCLWCEEPVAEGLRFCDAGCRDDYEKRAKRIRA